MSPHKTLTAFCAPLALLICGGAAASQTKGPTAQDIVGKMAAQYAQASSYQDTGVVERIWGAGTGRRETVIKFKTSFARPHFLLFEWTDRAIFTSEERLNAVWNDGKQTYHYYSWDKPAVGSEEDISLGVAGATGISRGSAHTVPTLLLEEVGGFRLTEMSNLSLLGEEKFEGEDCYIVRGRHPHNFPIDMWIAKSDFLLRKTMEGKADGTSEVEIRRDVKLNAKIPPETFNYTPPPPKPKARPRKKARPQGCGIAFARTVALCLIGDAKAE